MKVLMPGSRSKINRKVEKTFYSLLDRKSPDLDTVMLFVLWTHHADILASHVAGV